MSFRVIHKKKKTKKKIPASLNLHIDPSHRLEKSLSVVSVYILLLVG